MLCLKVTDVLQFVWGSQEKICETSVEYYGQDVNQVSPKCNSPTLLMRQVDETCIQLWWTTLAIKEKTD